MKIVSEILNYLFGTKYYANIINTIGTDKCEISCFIFRTKEDAHIHRDSLAGNKSFLYVETISFRSHYQY